MEWSFKYIGPKSRLDDRDCPICTTVARKKCQSHQSPAIGCPHCDAVRDGLCAAHCGVEAALERHNIAETDPANSKWVSVPGAENTVGRTQERRSTPMSTAKAERIKKATDQFAAARVYVMAQCALLPADCQVEVTARGDDHNDKLCGIDMSVIALGEWPEAEEEVAV